MNADPASVIRLLQITDTHLGADPAAELDGVNTLQSLQQVLSQLAPELPATRAILATGDLAHDGSAGAYSALRSCLARLGVPVYCIAGNHDEPAPMRAALVGGAVRMAASVRFGSWRILFVDTRVAGREGGELGERRRRRLGRLLETAAAPNVLIVMHHPPVRIASSWMDAMMLADADEFFAVVDRAPSVRGIVWGHIHQEYDRVRNGVRLLGAPSTCVQFRPGADRYQRDPLPPGYRWLRLCADGSIDTAVARLP